MVTEACAPYAESPKWRSKLEPETYATGQFHLRRMPNLIRCGLLLYAEGPGWHKQQSQVSGRTTYPRAVSSFARSTGSSLKRLNCVRGRSMRNGGVAGFAAKLMFVTASLYLKGPLLNPAHSTVGRASWKGRRATEAERPDSPRHLPAQHLFVSRAKPLEVAVLLF